MKYTTNKAFTLVELIAVLAISGTVLAVGAYKFNGAEILNFAQNANQANNAQTLNTALQCALLADYAPPAEIYQNCDLLIGDMIDKGIVSNFPYKGLYTFNGRYFYAKYIEQMDTATAEALANPYLAPPETPAPTP
jgi:prepilin-type N-terminal cleavage/methylation domain-containing protein